MNENNKLTIDDVADFVYCWGQTFFLETAKGNYFWSDPDYQGDNTIRPFAGNLKDFYRYMNVPFGRCKGTHFIKDYCGKEVRIIE